MLLCSESPSVVCEQPVVAHVTMANYCNIAWCICRPLTIIINQLINNLSFEMALWPEEWKPSPEERQQNELYHE